MPEISGYTPEIEASGMVPTGKYMALVKSVAAKDDKGGGGSHILDFQICEGPYKGENFDNKWYCINNSNKVCSKIANQSIKGFFELAGMPDEKNTDHLVNKVIPISLKSVMGDMYPEYNVYPDICQLSSAKTPAQGNIPAAEIPADANTIPF